MRHLALGLFVVLALGQAAPAEAKSTKAIAAEIVKNCGVADATAATTKQALINESKKQGWSKSKTKKILSGASEALKNKRAAYETSVTNFLSETYSVGDLQTDAQVCRIALVRQFLMAQISGKPAPDQSKLTAGEREILEKHLSETLAHVYSPDNNKVMVLLINDVMGGLTEEMKAE